jgi:Cu/Ag efflux protein CusF
MIRLPKWLLVMLALAVIISIAAPAMADTTKGKIKSVSADKNEFVFTDKDAKDWTFQVADNVKIATADNPAAKLTDLKAGDEATITYRKEGDKLIATDVRCEKK